MDPWWVGGGVSVASGRGREAEKWPVSQSGRTLLETGKKKWTMEPEKA
jgi:hypothetical protein